MHAPAVSEVGGALALNLCLPFHAWVALNEWDQRQMPCSLDGKGERSLVPGAVARLAPGLYASPF